MAPYSIFCLEPRVIYCIWLLTCWLCRTLKRILAESRLWQCIQPNNNKRRDKGWNSACNSVSSLANSSRFMRSKPVSKTCSRSNWISQVYQSSFSSKARGVAILFRKTVPFRLSTVISDPSGRYILVSGHINSFPITCKFIWSKFWWSQLL